MKLKAAEQANRDYLAKLNNTHRNLIAKKESEIKNLNELYNEKVKNTKTEGVIDLADQEEKNRAQIANSIKSKELQLEKLKSELGNHKESLAKEKELLTNNYQTQIQNTNAVFKDKYNHIYNDNLAKSEEILNKSNEQVSNLKKDSEYEIKSMNFESKIRADEISRNNARQIRSIGIENQQDINRTKQLHEDKVEELVNDHNKKVTTEERKHQLNYRQRVTSQETELKNIESHHQEILKQKRISFKEKYNNLEKNQKSILSRIKDKFESEIKSLVSKYSELKNQTLSKSQDDFYNVTELRPKILEFPNSYQVKIDVPEHEQELVNLTAQQRDLHISLTRNYRDETTSQDGEVNKTRRSEVLTKRLDVDKIMDSKKITRNYNEGVLTFNIAKL